MLVVVFGGHCWFNLEIPVGDCLKTANVKRWIDTNKGSECVHSEKGKEKQQKCIFHQKKRNITEKQKVGNKKTT